MKPVEGSGAQPVQVPQESPTQGKPKDAGGAEFDKVVEQKSGSTGVDRKKGDESARASGEAKTAEKPNTARSTEHGVQRHQEREGRQQQQSGGDEGGGGPTGQQSREEMIVPRALPGDMMMPFDFMSRMQKLDTAPIASAQSAESIALVQRIADQIVQAVQIKMHAGGQTDVKIELNLGKLGNVSVDLQRTAEGQIRIAFQAATSDAGQMLTSNLSDLTSRLEARGVDLAHIAVNSPDAAEFRWDPRSGAAQAEARGRVEAEQSIRGERSADVSSRATERTADQALRTGSLQPADRPRETDSGKNLHDSGGEDQRDRRRREQENEDGES